MKEFQVSSSRVSSSELRFSKSRAHRSELEVDRISHHATALNSGLKLETGTILPHVLSFSRTEKSSSVVTSPATVPLVAISRNSRRMIFPERVFGSMSVNRISSGRASAPISFVTWARNSAFNSADGTCEPSSVTKATIADPFSSSGRATTAASATASMRYQRAFDFGRSQTMAADVYDIVDAAHDPKITVADRAARRRRQSRYFQSATNTVRDNVRRRPRLSAASTAMGV